MPLIKQDITGFEIAVNNALLMCVIDGNAQAREKVNNLRKGGQCIFRSGVDIVSERLSLHILHEDICSCIVALSRARDSHIIHLNNVRMTQRGQRLPFLRKVRQKMRIRL